MDALIDEKLNVVGHAIKLKQDIINSSLKQGIILAQMINILAPQSSCLR